MDYLLQWKILFHISRRKHNTKTNGRKIKTRTRASKHFKISFKFWYIRILFWMFVSWSWSKMDVDLSARTIIIYFNTIWCPPVAIRGILKSYKKKKKKRGKGFIRTENPELRSQNWGRSLVFCFLILDLSWFLHNEIVVPKVSNIYPCLNYLLGLLVRDSFDAVGKHLWL